MQLRGYFSRLLNTPHPKKHGYQPAPLRWWFLWSILIYIACLLALLEYAIHTLPALLSRRTSPDENGASFHYEQTRTSSSPFPSSTAAPVIKTRQPYRRNATSLQEPSTFPNSTNPAASNSSQFTRPSNASQPRAGFIPPLQLHVNPSQYLQLEQDEFILHYRYNYVWVHDEEHPRLAIPAPPDVDLSVRCYRLHVSTWLTDNPEDCRAIVYFLTDYVPYENRAHVARPLGETEACREETQRWEEIEMNENEDGTQNFPDDYCWKEEWDSGSIIIFPKATAHLDSPPLQTPGSPYSLLTTKRTTTTTAPPTTTIWTVTTNGFDGKITVSLVTTIILGKIVTDVEDITLAAVDGIVQTLTDARGQPTATVTSLFGVSRPSKMTTTLRDTNGRPTKTAVTDAPVPATLMTMYNSLGLPIATSTRYLIPPSLLPRPSPPPETYIPSGTNGLPSTAVRITALSAASYLIVSFGPVLSTTILAIFAQILNSSLRTMAPFHALSRPGGALAEDSLVLSLDGSIGGPLGSLRLAWVFGEPLLLYSDILLLCSLVLVSLSSEAVGTTLGGTCADGDTYGCYTSLAVITGPARAVEALLATMGIIILGMILFMPRRWVASAKGNPTSITSIASLLGGDGKVRALLVEKAETINGFIQQRDTEWWTGQNKFGVNSAGHLVIVDEGPPISVNPKRRSKAGLIHHLKQQHVGLLSQHRKKTIIALGFRALFLIVLCGLLIVVTYYGSTKLTLHDPFERFMDSQTFGVSFLFTAAGSIADLFWSSFFARTDLAEPYRRLSSPNPKPSTSSYLTQPRSSNVFSGFARSAIRGNIYTGAVAFAGILSKILPLFLANVPFRYTLTWKTFVACTWTSVSVLAVMILVLFVSLFVREPHLPVEPNTIAGCLYYVADSKFVGEMEGGEVEKGGEGEGVVNARGRYCFGRMVGVSGNPRVGIDRVKGGAWGG